MYLHTVDQSHLAQPRLGQKDSVQMESQAIVGSSSLVAAGVGQSGGLVSSLQSGGRPSEPLCQSDCTSGSGHDPVLQSVAKIYQEGQTLWPPPAGQDLFLSPLHKFMPDEFCDVMDMLLSDDNATQSPQSCKVSKTGDVGKNSLLAGPSTVQRSSEDEIITSVEQRHSKQ
jgi:hypothetical protein